MTNRPGCASQPGLQVKSNRIPGGAILDVSIPLPSYLKPAESPKEEQQAGCDAGNDVPIA